MKKDEKLFDLRTLERNIAKGAIRKDEYKGFLKKLTDVQEMAEIIDKETIFGGEPSKIKGALVEHIVKTVQVQAPVDYDEFDVLDTEKRRL